MILLNSGGTPYFSSYILTSISLVLLLIVIIQRKLIEINNKSLSVFLLFSFSILFNFIMTGMHSSGRYLVIFSYIFLCFTFVTLIKSREHLIKIIYSVLKFILYFSVLCFFAQFVFSSHFVYNPNFKVVTFANIFNYSPSTYGFGLYRVQGFFWEPGILQFYLNLLLFVSMSHFRNIKLSSICAFSIITTYSSIGLFILACQILYFYFTYYFKFNGKSLVGLLFFVSLFSLFSLYAYENIEDKIMGKNAGSSDGRLFDAITGILIIKDKPLIGIGLSQERAFEMQKVHSYNETNLVSDETHNRGSTNGIISFIASFGVPLSLIVLYWLFFAGLIETNKNIFNLIIFSSLMSEPIMLSPFIILIILYYPPNLRKVEIMT